MRNLHKSRESYDILVEMMPSTACSATVIRTRRDRLTWLVRATIIIVGSSDAWIQQYSRL
jgi:hypothetical protein